MKSANTLSSQMHSDEPVPEGAGDDRLTAAEYWEAVWSEVQIPTIRTPRAYHDLHRLYKSCLPQGSHRLFEVGCAPGAWLAYFSRHFGYDVSGVEYARQAWSKTVQNLELLEVPANVFLADFCEVQLMQYDIVFSSGFIEHFSEPKNVVERLRGFCRPGGYVVTTVPALQGINWRIARLFRPEVTAAHHQLTKAELIELHECWGFQTVCARHYGCGRITDPLQKNRFASHHSVISKLINRVLSAGVHESSIVAAYPGPPCREDQDDGAGVRSRQRWDRSESGSSTGGRRARSARGCPTSCGRLRPRLRVSTDCGRYRAPWA